MAVAEENPTRLAFRHQNPPQIWRDKLYRQYRLGTVTSKHQGIFKSCLRPQDPEQLHYFWLLESLLMKQKEAATETPSDNINPTTV